VNINHHLGTDFLYITIISAVKRVEFDRMSHITLKDRWYDIVLNVHAPTEDKDDIKDSFYKELEQIFDQFSRYHMKCLQQLCPESCFPISPLKNLSD